MSSPGRTFPVKRYNCVLSRTHRVALTGSTGKLKDYLQKHSRIPKLVGFVARALQNVLVAQEKRPHTGKASLLHNLVDKKPWQKDSCNLSGGKCARLQWISLLWRRSESVNRNSFCSNVTGGLQSARIYKSSEIIPRVTVLEACGNWAVHLLLPPLRSSLLHMRVWLFFERFCEKSEVKLVLAILQPEANPMWWDAGSGRSMQISGGYVASAGLISAHPGRHPPFPESWWIRSQTTVVLLSYSCFFAMEVGTAAAPHCSGWMVKLHDTGLLCDTKLLPRHIKSFKNKLVQAPHRGRNIDNILHLLTILNAKGCNSL